MDLTLAYFLIVGGVIVMAGELFLPTHGTLLVAGLSGLIAGVSGVFHHSTLQGMATLAVVLVLVPVLAKLLLQVWPRTPMGKGLILQAPTDQNVGDMPGNQGLEKLHGRHGRTVSPLRPAGMTDFNGRRVDTLSEGDFIDAGQWVRCVAVQDGKVIVRPVDAPPSLEDFDLK